MESLSVIVLNLILITVAFRILFEFRSYRHTLAVHRIHVIMSLFLMEKNHSAQIKMRYCGYFIILYI